MITGVILIALSFVAAITATTAYYLYYRDGNDSMFDFANRSFWVTGFGVLISLAYLIFLILNHNFEVNYVYSYSSRILNKFYLFSTLWAGQQGTFLLWLTYGFIYGIILMRKNARKNPLLMVYLSLVQVFLLLILLKKSPFTMVWHQYAEVPVGFIPQDGAGLNPLLQNPWMVIHPPTLFVGYSSTVVPFLFAMSALIRRDHHSWIKDARPWVIFNTMILGVGIIMGGYWAYVTLGWGGYWGWDPVENASLVPWIFSIILLHGMLIQQKRKSLVRTNYLWAGLSFLTMLWGSYLTRSGVLTDFSVHSFAPSGLSAYLVLFQAVFTGLFLFFWVRFMIDYNRSGSTPVEFGKGMFNRETFIFFGMMALIFVAFFVLLGTSAPLFTQWFGDPISLSPDFYNTMIIPVSVFMFLMIAIAPLLAWKTSELRNKPTIIGAAVASLILTGAAATLGLGTMTSIGEHTPYYAIEGTVTPAFFEQLRDVLFSGALKYSPYLMFFLACMVIIINAKVAGLFIKRNLSKAGGYITHIGWGFMLIGTITSSVYDTSEKVMLPKGEFTEAAGGYQIQFISFIDMPDGRDRVKLRVRTTHGKEYDAYPQFYYSEYTKGYMVAPDVRAQFARDVYISPISYTPARLTSQQEVTLTKGQSTTLLGKKITFNSFKTEMGAAAKVTAMVTVEAEVDGKTTTYDVMPILIANGGKMSHEPIPIADTGYRIELTGVNAGSGQAKLMVYAPAKPGDVPRDMLAIELSEKPFISILWLGSIIFALGAFFALTGGYQKRFMAKKREEIEEVA
ncbi:MAG: cytochrome c biogenesis protein CcsA [Calditrichae bacterium]|nr:cytochrome c biogenesis protein CcsA [Calditrichia bacterium]